MSSKYGQLIKDLQVGFEEGEEPVQDFLEEKFGIITKNVGSEAIGWDLEFVCVSRPFIKKSKGRVIVPKYEKKFCGKYGRTFEIKRDVASDRTGNFFLEVWSNLKAKNPGCIQTAKADTLVIVRKKEFIFVDRAYFLSWILYNVYNETKLGKKWKKKTCGRLRNPEMKNSPVSPEVRGILINISDIRKIAIEVFKR